MTKSACTRASLIPYPVIAAAVGGDPEAVSRVVRHYSGYIAALSTRTSYGPDGYSVSRLIPAMEGSFTSCQRKDAIAKVEF